MCGAILKATNSSFQKCIPFCRSIYVKKVMKLLAFIFEQPSYILTLPLLGKRCENLAVAYLSSNKTDDLSKLNIYSYHIPEFHKN